MYIRAMVIVVGKKQYFKNKEKMIGND